MYESESRRYLQSLAMREVSRAAYLGGTTGQRVKGSRPFQLTSLFSNYKWLQGKQIAFKADDFRSYSLVKPFSVPGVDGHQGAPVPDGSKLALDGAVTRSKRAVFVRAVALDTLTDGRVAGVTYLSKLNRSH